MIAARHREISRATDARRDAHVGGAVAVAAAARRAEAAGARRRRRDRLAGGAVALVAGIAAAGAAHALTGGARRDPRLRQRASARPAVERVGAAGLLIRAQSNGRAVADRDLARRHARAADATVAGRAAEQAAQKAARALVGWRRRDLAVAAAVAHVAGRAAVAQSGSGRERRSTFSLPQTRTLARHPISVSRSSSLARYISIRKPRSTRQRAFSCRISDCGFASADRATQPRSRPRRAPLHSSATTAATKRPWLVHWRNDSLRS